MTRVDDETKSALDDLVISVEWSEWIKQSRIMVYGRRSTSRRRPTERSPSSLEKPRNSGRGGSGVTAREMGCDVETVFDVGVTGAHRTLVELHRFDEPNCVVVAAGIVNTPVIGLPVSIGYGAGSDGEATLLGMLQSCTVLSVVNIDAGFVAGA